MKLVAEQNAEIIEQLETIKNEFTGAFDSLAAIVTESVSNIKEDTNEKCKTIIKLNSKISRRKLGNDKQQTSAPRIKPNPPNQQKKNHPHRTAVPNISKPSSRKE